MSPFGTGAGLCWLVLVAVSTGEVLSCSLCIPAAGFPHSSSLALAFAVGTGDGDEGIGACLDLLSSPFCLPFCSSASIHSGATLTAPGSEHSPDGGTALGVFVCKTLGQVWEFQGLVGRRERIK